MPTLVIAGPCLVTWNSINFFTKGDVRVEMTRNLFEIMTDQHGTVDQRTKSAVIRVTFTPCGRATELAGLFSYFTGKTVGNSLVPAGTGNEKSLVIQPMTNAGGASKIWTFIRSGPTSIGATSISATQTMAGQVTFTCLASQVSASLGQYFTTASYSAPSSGIVDDFTQANITTLPCRLYWADDPDTLASGDYLFDAQAGWTVDLALRTKEHEREGVGIADVTLSDLNASVTGDISEAMDYQLTALTEAQVGGLLNMGSVLPGQPAGRKKLTLRALYGDGMGSVDEDGEILQLAKAEMTAVNLAWGSEQHRYGTIRFTGMPTFSAGVRGVPLAFGLT